MGKDEGDREDVREEEGEGVSEEEGEDESEEEGENDTDDNGEDVNNDNDVSGDAPYEELEFSVETLDGGEDSGDNYYAAAAKAYIYNTQQTIVVVFVLSVSMSLLHVCPGNLLF